MFENQVELGTNKKLNQNKLTISNQNIIVSS